MQKGVAYDKRCLWRGAIFSANEDKIWRRGKFYAAPDWLRLNLSAAQWWPLVTSGCAWAMQKGVAYDKRCPWRRARVLMKTKAGGEILCSSWLIETNLSAAQWWLEKCGDHRVQGSTKLCPHLKEQYLAWYFSFFFRKGQAICLILIL